MSLQALVQILAFSAGLIMAVMMIFFRRFGPASWILALFLVPAAGACGAGALPFLQLPTQEGALKIAFCFVLLCTPGGLLASYGIIRDDYNSYIRKRFVIILLTVLATLFLTSILLFDQHIQPGMAVLSSGGIVLGPSGFWSASYLLLISVFVLANLEQTLRRAEEQIRWEIKFLLIGLAAFFGALIYVASSVLLYPVTSGFVAADSIGLLPVIFIISCILIMLSWRRSSGQVRLIFSHKIIYSSITLLGVGIYLIASSLIARWAAQWSKPGFPGEALVFLLSLLVLILLVFTTAFRHRVIRWIRLNLIAGRYDYRQWWLEAIERLQSTDLQKHSAAALIEMVCRALSAIDISVWVRMRTPDRLQLLAVHGAISNSIEQDVFTVGQEFFGLTGLIEVKDGKGAVEAGIDPALLSQTKASIIVPLISSGRLVGLLTVGPDRSGRSYDWQSRELLGVLASHAAGEFHKSELLSSLVESKEMEAFHSFSTFLLHDLKNYSSTLMMVAQNAARYRDNPEFQKDAFQSVLETAEKMKRLCNNLRTFAVTPAPEKKPEDLNLLIRAAVDELNAGESKYIEMCFADVPAVQVDSQEMLSVIRNLLINALEAITSEGKIVVSTEHHGQVVKIAIKDNGKGMTPEFLRNGLFMPFHTTKSDGLGIGLYHTRKIIESYNGTIEIESAVEQGTTVAITIPVLQPKAASQQGVKYPLQSDYKNVI
jgi:putative PEP-CTERM system histidine kinase